MTIKGNRYTLSKHAVERANLRLGIAIDEVSDWANDVMRKAKYVSAQGAGRLLYEYNGTQFIVGDKTRTIITIHPATRLDFLRPTLEREIRKIKREHTRKQREMERILAGQYRKLSEQMTNYSNARNPQTRELVGERIKMTEGYIAGNKRSIERLEDETMAKIKAIEVITE